MGAVITDLRTSKTWSQQDLGDKIGYSKVYIVRIEQGKQSPTLNFIVSVAQVFGFRTSQLLARLERKRAKR